MPLISENRILPMDAQEIKRALCMYVVRIDHDLLATEANQVTSQWSRVNPSSKFADEHNGATVIDSRLKNIDMKWILKGRPEIPISSME